MSSAKQIERKILLIGPLPPPHNGQSIAFKMLFEGLKKHGVEADLVNLAGHETIGGSRFSWKRLWEHAGFMLRFAFKSIRPRKTVYLVAGQFLPGFLRDMVIIFYSRLLGHRVICHVHGGIYNQFYNSQPRFIQRMIQLTWLQVDRIIVLGNGLRGLFEFDERLGKKVSVIPNGYTPDRVVDRNSKRLPDGLSEPIRILFLSNLIESKGYFDLLEGVDILVKKFEVNVQCDFCGEFLSHPSDDVRVRSASQARRLFDEFIETRQLRGHIRYCGLVTGKEKEELLLKSHFFVLPTYYDVEGQPISIIEAMAYGNIVITTDYRAISDLVIDGKTGYFVPPKSPESIAGIIAEVAANRAMFDEVSRQANEHYRQNFTVETHLNRMLSLLAS